MEYHLRRHDGEYRWILDIGVPRFGQDGLFEGYIGVAVDVTEQKFAERALSEMTRKLIEAQEQERAYRKKASRRHQSAPRNVGNIT